MANPSRENEAKSDPESSGAEEDFDSAEAISEDEDDAPAAPVRSYAALMQSLAAEVGPQAKRRKLQHDSNSRARENEDDQEVAIEEFDPEEVEEGPETATDGLIAEDEDEVEDSSDPFEAHFADPDENVLAQRLKSIQKSQWHTQKTLLPNVGKALLSTPQSDGLNDIAPSLASGPEALKLKQKLVGIITKQKPSFDDLEQSIAPLIFSYQDVLYCERKPANAESLRRLSCLHAINHVFK